MSELSERYRNLARAREELEQEIEKLDTALQPHVKAWTEFCTEFETENGHKGRRSFWDKIGFGIRPWSGYRYELDIENPSHRGFSFRGESYDGDVEFFTLPYSFVQDPEAAKNSYRHEWLDKVGEQAKKDEDRALAERRALYDKLHAEFGDDTRSEFDKANPSQS